MKKVYDGYTKNSNKLKQIPEGINIISEWKNAKTIFSPATDESLEK
jgi:hypothetical protein